MSSREEIESQISEYEEQLEGINSLLAEDPSNEELKALQTQTNDLLAGLRDLLTPSSAPPSHSHTENSTKSLIDESVVKVYTQATESPIEEIAKSEPSQSLSELAFSYGLYVGLPSESIWEEDGKWYATTIESISDQGVRVKFKSYGDVVVLHPSKVRPSTILLQESKKRKAPDMPDSAVESHTPEGILIPEHLRILDTDSEKTKEYKRRQIKLLKQEKRKEKAEVAENQSKVAWQTFTKKLKKTGFATKKESMFRTTEGTGSKVGVVGSGKGMTQSSNFERIKRNPALSMPSSTATDAPSYDPLAYPAPPINYNPVVPVNYQTQRYPAGHQTTYQHYPPSANR